MNILCELKQKAKLAVDDEKKDILENIEKLKLKWQIKCLVHPCTDFEVRYFRHHRRFHRQYSFSKLLIVCTLNAVSRSIETMTRAVHTLCFTQLNYSNIDWSLSSVQCGGLCQVVNVEDYVR